MAPTCVLESPTRTVAAPCPAPALKAGYARLRQARAVVLSCLLAAAGLLFAGFVLVDGPQRNPAYNSRLQRLLRQIRAAPTKPFILVTLGSSRSAGAYRTQEISNRLADGLGRPVATGNFGLPGCSPATNLLTWNRLQHDGIRPDVVLIEVMPAMLSEQWYPNELTAEQLALGRLRRCDLPVMEKYFGDIRPGVTREWWRGLPNAIYDSRLTLLSRIAPDLLPPEHVVEQPETIFPEDLSTTDNVELPPDLKRRAMKAAQEQYFACMQTYQLGGRSVENFRQGLTQIRGDDVRAILVVMPEGPVFRSWYAPGAYEQVLRWLAEIQAEFGVEVVDARDWIEEADFNDSHHFNARGALRFNNRLVDEHLLPILKGQSRSPTSGPQASAR